MDYWTVTAAFLALIVSWLSWAHYRRYKDFPPGPYGLPVLGYAFFLGEKPYLTFKDLSRKYGSVFSVTIGSTPSVVVNDFESLKEILVRQGEVFSGRPDLLTLDVIFRRKDIASAEGPEWKACKRFTMQILRDFGVGRSSLESVVMEEVDKLTDNLRARDNQSVDMTSVFFCSILNVIWRIAADKVFDPSDASMANFKKAFQDVSCNSNVSVVNTWPFLRYIAPKAIGYSNLTDGVRKIYAYLSDEVDLHERKFAKNNLKDVTDIYLAEIDKRKDSISGKEQEPYNKEYLLGTLLNLFLGGVGTLETTLHWAMLLMALHPEVQRKVQRELDAAVSDDSYLSQSSRSLIPYTEATLLEVQRYSSIVPFAMPHCTTKACTLKGYKIPARTFIFPNLWAVHHDERYWTDPSNFRPERFLNDDGSSVVKHECFLPFSSGPRSCPGEALAKLELFLFFTSLLRRCSFDVNPGESKPSLEPVFGVTLQPQAYSLLVKRR